MATHAYYKQALTGGTATALDAVSVSSLSDGDFALTMYSDKLYVHKFNATGTDATSSPTRIRPTDFATTNAGVWEQQTSPIDSNLLAGTVIAWPHDTEPSGYMTCDGAEVSISVYSALYAIIGTRYGGNGTTTFKLPNYQGEFLRGYDSSATTDPDAASRTASGDGTGDSVTGTTGVGTRQLSAFKAHTHTHNTGSVSSGNQSITIDSTSNDNELGTSISTTGDSTNETRPRNVNVMWCIKY